MILPVETYFHTYNTAFRSGSWEFNQGIPHQHSLFVNINMVGERLTGEPYRFLNLVELPSFL